MLMDGSQDGEDRWANLLELREVVDRYADLEPEDALDRLLEETALVADQDAYAAGSDAVTLITLHAAKGLEFDVVFIAGWRRASSPTRRALDDPRQMEEERRLAYVGLTRARHRLYLTHAAQRATWGRGGFSLPQPLPDGDPRGADAWTAPRGPGRGRRPAARRRAGRLPGVILGGRTRGARAFGGRAAAGSVGAAAPAAGWRLRAAAGCAAPG